jgi:hypothetical protein
MFIPGLEKPVLKKKNPAQWAFLVFWFFWGFFGVFLRFWGFIGFFWVFWPRREVFQGVFQFHEYF